jgi:glutamate-1-semialdehyde 2,1-aminomutase
MTKWTPGKKSREIFKEACRVIPGGVNSPVRAFGSVGLEPFIVERARGAFVYDVDGNEYIDFMGSWGPMILGHANQKIFEAAVNAFSMGASFGASHAAETKLAVLIAERIESIEKVRLVSSGTEAAMSAVRLARGFTGRDKIIKFDGCYHGHGDSFLINAGSGAATLGIPGSPGVPAGSAKDTLSAEYNNLESVEELLKANSDEVAAVIVEPVAGNMGCIPPAEDFLKGLRLLCDQYGSLLVFDEVITGFRIAYGGAFERYGVKADLTTLGKILGGGMPVGAFGGRADIMDCISPDGSVYQAGTLSGNPVAVACGIAALEQLDTAIYEQLENTALKMERIITGAADKSGVSIAFNRVGSMMGFFFSQSPVYNYNDARQGNTAMFNTLFEVLLQNGVSIAPSAFEVMFVSSRHTDEVLDKAAPAFDKAFRAAALISDRPAK